jgi:hypothetical protein
MLVTPTPVGRNPAVGAQQLVDDLTQHAGALAVDDPHGREVGERRRVHRTIHRLARLVGGHAPEIDLGYGGGGRRPRGRRRGIGAGRGGLDPAAVHDA